MQANLKLENRMCFFKHQWKEIDRIFYTEEPYVRVGFTVVIDLCGKCGKIKSEKLVGDKRTQESFAREHWR